MKRLGLNSWKQFQTELTEENWQKLHSFLNDDKTYTELLKTAICFLCVDEIGAIVGMSFLISSGKQTSRCTLLK